MKRWNTGWNDYWFTASLILDEASLPLVFLEWFMDWLCYLIGFIPWIGDYFHIWIHDPIYQFVWKHTKTTWIPLPYAFVKDTFPKEYKEFERGEWDDPEDLELINNNWKRMMELHSESMVVYDWKRMMELHSEFMVVYEKFQKHGLFFENRKSD